MKVLLFTRGCSNVIVFISTSACVFVNDVVYSVVSVFFNECFVMMIFFLCLCFSLLCIVVLILFCNVSYVRAYFACARFFFIFICFVLLLICDF